MRNRKVPFIEQMEHSECGLACIVMILGYYGKNISLSDIRVDVGVPKGGFSLLQMKEIASDYEMEGKAFKGSIDDLVTNGISSPIILFWENKHFVVLEKIRGKKFVIVDPKVGRKIINKDEFSKSFSGVFLSLLPKEKFEKKKNPNYLLFLLKYVTKSPRLLITIIFFSLVVQSLALSIPLVTKWVTDDVLLVKETQKLEMLALIITIVLIGYASTSFLRGYFIAKLQTLLDSNMMTHFINHLLHLPYGFFENRSNGELLFRANSYVYIRQILSTRLISLFIDGILLFTYGILMMKMSVLLGSVVISIGLILFILLLLSTRITHNITNKDVTNQGKVQQTLTESITGITDIKVMGLEGNFYDDWANKFQSQLKSSENKSIWSTTLNIAPSTVQFVLPLSILFIGGYGVINGTMTLGILVAFNTMALSFIAPISTLGLAYSEIISLKSYIQRLYDVVKTETENETNGVIRKNLTGEIELRNLSFRYNKYSDYAIKNLNLKISKGETIAIVGKSGSGKSTIAKLLLRLYNPTEGEIYYDGINADKFDVKNLRTQLGAVLQETILFNKTISDNIILGNQNISEKQLIKACKSADILGDILKSPIGFDTIISEQGANFSGGQRQRLILARALIKEPPILILDEATSALDNLSETKIEQSVSELNCTRIIIAHRLSTIRNADKILVLDEGCLVEEGNHEELIEKKGLYYDLYNANKEKKKKFADTFNV